MVITGSPFKPDFNLYDVRLPCENGNTCYPEDGTSLIVNSREFREKFGVDEMQSW